MRQPERRWLEEDRGSSRRLATRHRCSRGGWALLLGLSLRGTSESPRRTLPPQGPEAHTGSELPLGSGNGSSGGPGSGTGGSQEPNWCVKGDEAERSWQQCPGPQEGGRRLPGLVELGRSIGLLLHPLESSSDITFSKKFLESFPELEGPLPLPGSNAWCVRTHICLVLQSPEPLERQQASSVSCTRPVESSCSANTVQP